MKRLTKACAMAAACPAIFQVEASDMAECSLGGCPSVTIAEGDLIIIGTIATEQALAAGASIGTNEAAVLISREMVEESLGGWRPIAEADTKREIVALSKDHCDGKRPLVLTYYKHHGKGAWRDWDADPHFPEVFAYVPE